MILSMTGFASHERNTANGVLQIELRSVNQRYLELQPKLDDSLRAYESLVREMLKAKLGRGKVECRINLMQAGAEAAGIQLNQTALKQIAEAVEKASAYFTETQPVNMLDVIKMPGVMETTAVDTELLEQDIQSTLQLVIDDLIAARAREGDKLKAMIQERVDEVQTLVNTVKPMLPEMTKAYQEKLIAKLQEAQQTQDDERIRQEMVIYAQRIDVDEELSRLSSHVEEVKRILSEGGVVGKRLDFLMQEMNREANTLGSKSVSIESTKVSMELKVLIEQMREQIQNIE